MNSRRAIILIVAIALGILATVGLLSYIGKVERAALEDQQTAEVWVVTQPIPKGTSAERVIAENFIGVQEVPVSMRPSTAITDPQTELAGLVAITDLPPNAPLVAGNFVSPSVVATGITDRLEEKGMVTVTFSVDNIRGAAYLMEPGDFVNILRRYPIEEVDAAGEGEEEEPDIIITELGTNRDGVIPFDYDARYVYLKSEILAIDKSLPADLGDNTATADGEPGAAPAGPANGGLITLAVPPDVAQYLLSIGIEDLYLSLVPPSYEPEVMEALDLGETVLPGEDADRLTPYGPDAEPVE